ncbi:MAG: hypothetical protein KKD83_08740 [Chloroflexi bacterium]|nr:hypothetical protein [Chloroflexota bacterium]
MGAVKDKVRDLVQMLDSGVEEAKSLVDTMHKLQIYLDAESKTIIEASLDRLLNRVRMEVDNLIGGSARVLVSPEGRVTVGTTYSDEDSDSWLKRLKSQDFSILRPDGFSAFIKSLKSEVAAGNWMPVIEFLRANAKFEAAPAYLPTPAVRKAEQPSEPSSSGWKPSDFLPALPPHPPLPRGLFKD